MIINFFFCWNFVFISHSTLPKALFRYSAIAVIIFSANQWLLPVAVWFFPANPSLARMAAAATVSVFQYFALKVVAFG